MASPAPSDSEERARSVVFGNARWDRAERRLTVRGEPAKLTWRVAECLSILVEAGGEVVTKEDLQRQIWGGALVEDSNVPRCIVALRKALDPAPDGGSHIETVARVGYRLTVEVTGEISASYTEPEAPRRLSRWAVAAGCAVLMTALAGGLVAWKHTGREKRTGELIQRALWEMRHNSQIGRERAADLLRQARDLNGGSALLLAARAEHAARNGFLGHEVAIDMARQAAGRDPSCAECQAIAGFVLMTRGWKWDEAGKHLARAIEIDGNNTMLRLWYGEWLAIHGRFPEALAQAEAAVRSHPQELRARALLAEVLFLSGRYREAIREGETAMVLDASFQPAHYWKWRSYAMVGDDVGTIMSRSLSAAAAQSEPQSKWVESNERLQKVHSEGGRLAVARTWLKETSGGPPLEVQRYNRAVWYAWIGEHENAVAELEAAVKSKPFHLIYVAVDPAFAPLRSNPRYREVVRQVGLKPAAASSN